MFDTADNAYNVDKKIDYSTVRSMVIRSLEKIAREGLNRHSSQRRVNLNKTEEEGEEEDVVVVVADTNHLFDNDTIIPIVIETKNKKYNRIPKMAHCNLKA
jgi:ribosomal protein L18E